MNNRNEERRRRADIVIIAANGLGTKDIVPTLKPFHINTSLPVSSGMKTVLE